MEELDEELYRVTTEFTVLSDRIRWLRVQLQQVSSAETRLLQEYHTFQNRSIHPSLIGATYVQGRIGNHVRGVQDQLTQVRKQKNKLQEELKSTNRQLERSIDGFWFSSSEEDLTDGEDDEEDLADDEDDPTHGKSSEEIKRMSKQLDSEIGSMRTQIVDTMFATRRVRDLTKRIERRKTRFLKEKHLPKEVASVVEILELDEEEGGNKAEKRRKYVILKTSEGKIFLPLPTFNERLQPGDQVAVRRDGFQITSKLPHENFSVQRMLVDKKPTDTFDDLGGLEEQIQELKEAIVWPITRSQMFLKLGIQPPKGVLLHGPTGTGKTALARACACAAEVEGISFLRVAGPEFIQGITGGAKLVRDFFALAKAKAPCIIFIDEIDAIGAKRFDSGTGGDKVVNLTLLELLDQLNEISNNDMIKVIAATNRIDVLDPALMRSGRFDRKIELPLPSEAARVRILQIHSRKMSKADDVNLAEIARSTENFNGAELKSVCAEAGMHAPRRDASQITHEDFIQGISEVKKRGSRCAQEYFA